MILVNSYVFIEQSKKAVEEFCVSAKIDGPNKAVEGDSGIAFRWPKIILMVGDDAEKQGATRNELFVRIIDDALMGAVHFISKDHVRTELIDFLEKWFPVVR